MLSDNHLQTYPELELSETFSVVLRRVYVWMTSVCCSPLERLPLSVFRSC
jgi:hypothetical protein